jgi:hypothetical protein
MLHAQLLMNLSSFMELESLLLSVIGPYSEPAESTLTHTSYYFNININTFLQCTLSPKLSRHFCLF